MPNLTQQAALSIAKEAIEDRQLSYDAQEGFRARFDGPEKLRNDETRSVWTIAYVTPSGLIDPRDHYIYVDDESSEFLYIITPTGYIE